SNRLKYRPHVWWEITMAARTDGCSRRPEPPAARQPARLLRLRGNLMTDSNVPWYRSFFGPDYLAVYAPEFDAAASEAQAVFCARVLGLEPGQSVLDLCCGQGRHAVPLARLGLRVTGLDRSAEYLRLAESAAAAADVGLRTVEADMREIP